uniref:uncharacterized protein LOC122600706 n=1 Tax=Erigeron canadensis TaxID=72917 RepID=UPI001CB8E23E|nr:uncharacterized protein LOC122600706 [Erigeron canadensis]
MSTLPARHNKPLHNFSLPFLKWGQRIHINHRRRNRSNSPHTDSDSDFNKPHSNQTNEDVLVNTTENNKLLPENGGGGDVVGTAVDGDVKPWNLRPRRLVTGSGGDGNGVKSVRGGVGVVAVTAAATAEEEEDRSKKRRLWISLSKEEIEEDIYAFTGSKPARRPKKRSKIAQKQVDNVSPGLYLVGISSDSYRV